MRFIKSYSLFESSTYSEMKNDIMDMCLELTETGKVECDILPGDRASSKYQPCDFMVVFFDKDDNWNGFHISTVIEYLCRIKDYLGNLYGGCGVVFIGDRERINIDLSNERQLIGELYGKRISNIAIFVKPEVLKESFTNFPLTHSMIKKYTSDKLVKMEMTKRDVSDMLLELRDVGFEFSVSYSPLTQVGRDDEPKLVVLVSAPSNIFEKNKELFNEVIERIKYFVKISGYVTGESLGNNYSGSRQDFHYKMYQLLIQ